MQEGKSSNPMIRTVLSTAKNMVPELLHKCPYVGHYEVIDAKPMKDLLVLAPTGVIRANIKLSDGNNTEVFISFLTKITN